jgi:hypothetical protein
MLKVQEFLLAGNSLELLEKQFSIKIKHNDTLNVVCLNYDQINSPLGEEIVQECRALVLERDTWQVKSWPFKKFFNVGEYHAPNDFDWDDFVAFDKLDGSIIHFWHHNALGWQVGTRSVPDSKTPYCDDASKTFYDLICATLLEQGTSFEELTSFFTPGFCYTFELTAPENQVVVYYEKRRVFLLGVRNINTLEEENAEDWINYHLPPWIDVHAAKSHPGWTLEQITKKVQELNPREEEGFVLVDKNWNRMKIKSEAYCLMSHSRDSLGKSNKSRLELIFTGKEDDVLPILPKAVQDKIISLKEAVMKLQNEVSLSYTKISHIHDQKEFALEALKTKYSGMLFALRKNPLLKPSDAIKQTMPKKVLELLSLQEEDTE